MEGSGFVARNLIGWGPVYRRLRAMSHTAAAARNTATTVEFDHSSASLSLAARFDVLARGGPVSGEREATPAAVVDGDTFRGIHG